MKYDYLFTSQSINVQPVLIYKQCNDFITNIEITTVSLVFVQNTLEQDTRISSGALQLSISQIEHSFTSCRLCNNSQPPGSSRDPIWEQRRTSIGLLYSGSKNFFRQNFWYRDETTNDQEQLQSSKQDLFHVSHE